MTITVAIVYILAGILATPGPGRLGYEEVYRTTDKAACEAHAVEWSAKLAPQKFACITLDTSKLKQGGTAEADN